jgi:site-specific recombinase XerD
LPEGFIPYNYLTVAKDFYEFLAAERLIEPNLPRVRLLIRQRARRVGQRLPQFPRDHIKQVLEHAINLTTRPVRYEMEKLRNLRNRAFLVTLADTGLRVHEACGFPLDDHAPASTLISRVPSKFARLAGSTG